jgi:hypothetical protein
VRFALGKEERHGGRTLFVRRGRRRFRPASLDDDEGLHNAPPSFERRLSRIRRGRVAPAESRTLSISPRSDIFDSTTTLLDGSNTSLRAATTCGPCFERRQGLCPKSAYQNRAIVALPIEVKQRLSPRAFEVV